ncbi:MAG: ATP-binding cassette domain-containing protein, partial [Treponema sp.]|nr:ATP-binding cassette domain-containing protein [Treponema sp.]
MKVNVILPALRKLYNLLPQKHRAYFIALIFITIGFSLVETIGITAIMPFISVASDPGLIDSGIYKTVYDFLGINGKNNFIVFFGIAIIVFYIFRALYSIIHTWLVNRFSMAICNFFSKKLFTIYLSIPYTLYVQKNSGEMVGLINSESRQLSNIANNILLLFTELFTIMLVYALMIIVDWSMTIILTLILAVLVLIFLNILIKKNKALGIKRVELNMKTFRILMEAFGNYKFVRLKGNKNDLHKNFSAAMVDSSKTQVISNTLSVMPKSILESLGFSLLIAMVIYILLKNNDSSMIIPMISMYALALYRILPSLHRLLGNVNHIAFLLHVLDKINDVIHLPVEQEGDDPVSFNEVINLKNITFKYATGDEVINGISLEIRKGEKIAVTGESGGGKTTLIDLVIGIHKPLSGEITVDGAPLTEKNIRSWRKKIGYIPQSIYLFDGTVGENVAYGSKCDAEKVIDALQKANIWDFLLTKDGLETKVGQGGIQLSGGQQQRIGIARALYNDPEILVLDEATSSLDNETEAKIMDEIYQSSMNKTLIVIAHRLSTVVRCERNICIEEGVLKT